MSSQPVMRIRPDLAIVPSMIASVRVVERYNEEEVLSRRSSLVRPCGHHVVVKYLMGDEQTVAEFGMSATFWYDASHVEHRPDRHTVYVGAYVPLPDDEYDRSFAESEARAHVVYEAIIQAIKESQ